MHDTQSAELVRILREQVARQDERIETLEKMLEQANQALSRRGAGADSSGKSKAARSPSAAPIKLPNLGPQIDVIAHAVAMAASSKKGDEAGGAEELIDTGRLKRQSASRKPGILSRLGFSRSK